MKPQGIICLDLLMIHTLSDLPTKLKSPRTYKILEQHELMFSGTPLQKRTSKPFLVQLNSNYINEQRSLTREKNKFLAMLKLNEIKQSNDIQLLKKA
jgi:hypothetical protein